MKTDIDICIDVFRLVNKSAIKDAINGEPLDYYHSKNPE